MIWLIVAYLLDRAQLKLAAGAYNSPYNGLGCVDAVLARRADAPMAYRVLVPWLIGLAERLAPGLRRYRVAALYEPFKVLSIAAALAMVARVGGPRAALLVAAMLPATFLYDYWDWPVEMFAFAAALTGDPALTLLGCVLCALSRETAPLVPLTYLLATWDARGALLLGLVVVCVAMAVRLYVGPRHIYFHRWMWRVNWRDVREIGLSRPFWLSEIALALVITALTLASVFGGWAGPAWPVPLALLASAWLMARPAETRVFSSCFIWIAFMLQQQFT